MKCFRRLKRHRFNGKKVPGGPGKKGSQVDRDQKLRIEERTMLACDEISILMIKVHVLQWLENLKEPRLTGKGIEVKIHFPFLQQYIIYLYLEN